MKHYNQGLVKDIQERFNFKTENIDEVENSIYPVVEIKPRINIIKNGLALNTTGTTLYTTPSDKDFILTGFDLSTSKDAVATNTSAYLIVIIDGASVPIGRISSLSGIASNGNMSNDFVYPIKIDRGTNITIGNDTNVAEVRTYATIYGFIKE